MIVKITLNPRGGKSSLKDIAKGQEQSGVAPYKTSSPRFHNAARRG
jgi:hypothetical protein